MSAALKARMRKNCKRVSIVIYMRCRFIGSGARWFWLARIIRGSSQQVRISKGAES